MTRTTFMLLQLLLPTLLWGQPKVVSEPTPVAVFSGQDRRLRITLHNPEPQTFVGDLRTRLYQATSATTAPFRESEWKPIQILAGQTVVETATFDFPLVRAQTPFLVQWLAGTNKVLGVTQVLVYPPDLLKELKPLAGDEPVGVFDPENQLKPLLKANKVDVVDLEDAGLEGFQGKLAILGPFRFREQMREALVSHIKTVAEKGVAIVWLQPPPEKRQELMPSFFTVSEGKGAVVVVQADLIANLAESPQAQLNLVHLARAACHPEPLTPPYPSP